MWKVLSVLDLKDAFHSAMIVRKLKKIFWYTTYILVAHPIYISECLWD